MKANRKNAMWLFPSDGDKNIVMIEIFFLKQFEKEEEEKSCSRSSMIVFPLPDSRPEKSIDS